MKQVIVRLKGGLGNQMFQYAFGKYISLKTKSKLFFDLYYLNNPLPSETKRAFELNVFNLNLELLSTKNADQLNNRHSYFNRIIRKIKLIPTDFQEVNDANYTQLLNDLPTEINRFIIDGYFQDYSIANQIRQELLVDFKLKTPLLEGYDKLVDLILKNNVVSVHVRRGDYINNPHAASHHYLQPISYYNEALAIFRTKYDEIRFLFFSDDIQWCKEQFTNVDTYFCDDQNSSAINDLMLMQLCNHHIIANSSFSWWGAWLSKKQGHVIAPKIWLNDPSISIAPLIPNSWQQL